MPTSEMSYRLLDGRQAAALAGEMQALHAEVYTAPPFRHDVDAAEFTRRWRVRCRQPGFALAEARHGGYLLGFAAGMPLRPSTSWWRELTTPLPEEVTTEHPGRTFALTDLLVRAAWRRQGIGRELHDAILAARTEERATLTIDQAAAPALAALQRWGWRKAGRARNPRPGGPALDVLIRPLPAARLPGHPVTPGRNKIPPQI
jgi:GNAT superfamily N-acetyltransferase